MFGYVKPFIPRLMVCEYENYKAVYCGVCKAMGRMSSPFVRLTLSYDFVFVALMKNAALGTPLKTVPFRCKLNPLKKRALSVNSEALEYAACVALIMMYFKGVDDGADKKGLSRLLVRMALPFLRKNAQRAAQKYPELYTVVEECVQAQKTVESSVEVTVDLAADPSAAALGKIFAAMDPEASAQLYDFGYMLGRWVYLIDAADDLYQDQKAHCFNPLLSLDRERVNGILNLTVTETASRFDALPARLRHPIADNTVTLGLPYEQKKVMRFFGMPKPKGRSQTEKGNRAGE